MFSNKRKYDTITPPSISTDSTTTDLDDNQQHDPILDSLITKHVETIFELGKHYLLKNDQKNAKKYFTIGVAYNCVKSINELAKMFAKTDKAKAIELYEQGIDKNSGLCANNLGYLYFSDKKPDYMLASSYFKKAINLGYFSGHYNYAYVCHKHLAKYDKASEHYKLFMPYANAEHHYRFYGMFLRDIDKNQEDAIKMFAKGLCLSRNGITYKYRILEHSEEEQVLIYEELKKNNVDAVIMEILCTMSVIVKYEFKKRMQEMREKLPNLLPPPTSGLQNIFDSYGKK
jgi:tetratricopeptide (TPR) repeat protein